jgi:NAD-dependent deacetylase
MSCTQCFKKFESKLHIKEFIEKGSIPTCPNCNGILKPDVILFGEQLPQSAWFDAQRAARQCDLMLVAGSSLEVLPVAGLPMQALDRGAHLIIVNNTPTYLNVRADVVLMQDVSTILPEIAKRAIHG